VSGPYHKEDYIMKIEIFSAQNAARELKSHRNRWHVVSLRDAPNSMGLHLHPVTPYEDCAKSIIIKYFDDISDTKYEMSGYVAPKREDILDIFDWVDKEDPKNLMVHCFAGVSRSSAVAYLIAYRKFGPKRANKVIDSKLHRPNSLVLDLGMSIMKGY